MRQSDFGKRYLVQVCKGQICKFAPCELAILLQAQQPLHHFSDYFAIGLTR